MTTETIAVSLDDAGSVLALRDLAELLNRMADRGSRWAVSGPGVPDLRRGRVDATRLDVIATGDGMFDAQLALIKDRSSDAAPAIAERFDLDVAFTPKRLRLDRREVSRAYRLALHNPEILTLAVNDTAIAVPVVRPFDAYIVSLARMLEHPRGTHERSVATDRVFDLYTSLGGTFIDDEMGDLHLRSTQQLRALGLRRRDVDAFRAWHTGFLRERSPKARPPIGERLRSGLRAAGNWGAGRDFDQPEPPGR